MKNKKQTLRNLRLKKEKGEKITFITAYDFPTARISEEEGIDLILVGDSVANNVLGYNSTNPVTMDEMLVFANAVRRGAPNTFVIGDMPFLSYQTSNRDAVYNAGRFIKEADMDAVKLEGGLRMENRISAIADGGIAVMGHIGYTPQSTNLDGIVQAITAKGFQILNSDALSLQKAGAFSILLEAVPEESAKKIKENLSIPIYGIGSSSSVDGVLAIMHDVIGLGNFRSKFVKNFSQAGKEIRKGISSYISAVKSDEFPGVEHCYKIKAEEIDKIKSIQTT
jgi:3-methyl-2-oxobutanoate hydroxymethyltransferase